MDQRWLRERAREAIKAGQLPSRPADRTWGGPGTGLDCAICGRPLPPQETELELEFLGSSEEGHSVRCHVHVGCFHAWQLECRGNLVDTRQSLSAEGDDGTMRSDERSVKRHPSSRIKATPIFTQLGLGVFSFECC